MALAPASTLLNHILGLVARQLRIARAAWLLGDRNAYRCAHALAAIHAQSLFDWMIEDRAERRPRERRTTTRLVQIAFGLVESYQATDQYDAAAGVARRTLEAHAVRGRRRARMIQTLNMATLRPIVRQLRSTRG